MWGPQVQMQKKRSSRSLAYDRVRELAKKSISNNVDGHQRRSNAWEKE